MPGRNTPEFGPQIGDEARRPAVAAPSVGSTLVLFNTIGTAVFTVVAVAGEIWPESLTLALIVVSLVAFAAGSLAFLVAFAVAIVRSRHEAIGMGGLFFLAGSAPRQVQVLMMGAWGVQIIVAFVVASLGVFTGAAFALLAPMWGIGLAGLWGARHGVFPPRVSSNDGAGTS
jgi:hypothetical protein